MRALLLTLLLSGPAWAGDWTSWRGPAQDGTSTETGTPTGLDLATDLLWTLELPSRGTPAVHGDRVYVWGYEGTGSDLAEVLVALNVEDGRQIWKHRIRDFISDIIYNRYSIGAPTVDPATGHIYLQTSAGLLLAFDRDGNRLWEVSMMEAWGRLTFPNGRTGAPLVDGDLVIVHGITANWGAQGPARDRFHAFDKTTGTPVWASTPGTAPKDSSFSTPVIADRDGRRVLYSGTGCGNIVAVDVATGAPLWRTRISAGGVNISPVLVGNTLVVSHAKENLDATNTGRMLALDVTAATEQAGPRDTPVLQGELWRNDDGVALSSSPIVVDGIIYLVNMTGELVAVDLETGKTLYKHKLGPDQLHASPTFADGKLYIPMHDGSFHILAPSRQGVETLATVDLGAAALGAPAISNGRVFVTTTERMLVFGTPSASPTPEVRIEHHTPGRAVALRARPVELLLREGESVPITVDVLDSHGQVLRNVVPTSMERWIPPTAKVRSEMAADWQGDTLRAADDAGISAGAFQIGAEQLTTTARGRTVAGLGFSEDFESAERLETDADGALFAYPPLAWIGARIKWQVREHHGEQVLAKTLDRLLFQRSTVFIGHPDQSDYTLSADVMSDGDRRLMSAVGLVNQRYRIILKGNQRVLEVVSNQERLKESVRFDMTPGTWYRLRTQVSVGPDGTTTIRAKAWPRDTEEPAAWTLEVRHAEGHTHGAPGLYGFTPQNLHRIYIDNVELTRTAGAAP